MEQLPQTNNMEMEQLEAQQAELRSRVEKFYKEYERFAVRAIVKTGFVPTPVCREKFYEAVLTRPGEMSYSAATEQEVAEAQKLYEDMMTPRSPKKGKVSKSEQKKVTKPTENLTKSVGSVLVDRMI